MPPKSDSVGNPVLPAGATADNPTGVKTPEQLKREAKAAARLKKLELKKKRKPVVLTLQIQHDFTNEERLALGESLNGKFQAKGELDAQKKAVVKDYGSRIETINAEANGISNKISSGFEMRPQECLVYFKPKERTRFVFALDGKFIRTEEMQPSDFQTSFLPELDKKYSEGGDLSKKQLKEAAEVVNKL